MSNPIYRLLQEPVLSLTDLAWVVVLLAAMAATWYAATRNVIWLREFYGQSPDGISWEYMPTFWWTVRAVGLLLILAVDLVLLAGILETLS
jgi:hypothetical protein